MKSSIIISIFLMAMPFTASAGGIGNIFAGFTNGVNQTQQQNYNAQQDSIPSHYLTQDMIKELIARYNSCSDANMVAVKKVYGPMNSFSSAIAQANQCISSAQNDFWLKHPDLSADWNKSNESSGNLKATRLEAEQLRLLQSPISRCVLTLSRYSGPTDVYVGRAYQAFKTIEDAKEAQSNKYIRGEITRGEMAKEWSLIGHTYQASLNRILDDESKASDAVYEKGRNACSAQLESQKQEIYDEEAEQTISRQHRRIEDLDEQNQAAKQAIIASQRKLQQAKEEATDAERKEQEAEGEAEQERQQQASYR